jgi:RND family efflux transporter MFP subunit
MKKWIFSGGMSLAILLSFSISAKEVIAVTTMVAKPQKVTQQLMSIGTVMSQRTTYIQTEIAGRVMSLYKSVGDPVKAGMIVAKMNPDITKDTFTEAKAVMLKAQAAYQAQSIVVRRVKKLVKAHATTLSVLEGEQVKLKVYESDYIAAKAQLAKAQFAVNHTNVNSTVSGTVQEKKVTVGSVIAAGDPVYLIANVTHLEAILPFPQTDRNKVKLGQSVKLVAPSGDSAVEAKIDNIKPMIDPVTRSFEAIVKFNNIQRAWHPGSSVTGYVDLGNKVKIFFVPEMAVVNATDGNYIYTIKNNKAYKVKVTTGDYNQNGEIAIIGGLKAGEKIITKGGAFLQDGMQVKEV